MRRKPRRRPVRKSQAQKIRRDPTDTSSEDPSASQDTVPSAGFRGRIITAVTIFVVIMALFYGFIHSPFVGPDPFEPYLALIARVSGGILAILGQNTTVVETSVSSPDFSMRMVRGCDAIEPTAAFVAAVVASPVSIWPKIAGIVVGTIGLAVINLVRIVSLYFVGVHVPAALDFLHVDVWQAAFIVLVICAWAVWVQWATRPHAD